MAGERARVLLLRIDQTTSRKIHEASYLYPQIQVETAESQEDALLEISKGIPPVDVVVVGTEIHDPVQTAQRLHFINTDINVILLSEVARLPGLQKSLQFAPFLGSEVSSFSLDRLDRLPDRISEAVDSVQLKRRYQTLLKATTQDIQTFRKPTPMNIQRTYLDRLLDHAPIGIVVVNVNGEILSWNRCAAVITGLAEAKVLGSSFQKLFTITEQGRTESLLRAVSSEDESVATEKATLKRVVEETGQEQYLDVTATHLFGRNGDDGILILFQDISHAINAENALKEAIRTRDEFISICSHELKTPITSMKLQFQLAEKLLKKGDKRVFSEEQVERRVVTANRQLDRMVALIEEMLDVSRIGAGKLQFHFDSIDLSEVLREVLDRFAEQFSELSLHVEEKIASEKTLVRADRFRLEQVISNLFTNAIKYGSGNTIHVSLVTHGASARVVVQDQGMGIAPEHLETIFNRFERVNSSASISGLGLGLYITKEIVLAHGGKIWAESDLGLGSTFTVELPAHVGAAEKAGILS